jgi:D-alanyl-D-alanine carboxypeptidase (penicillin-binding protein 5/6)
MIIRYGVRSLGAGALALCAGLLPLLPAKATAEPRPRPRVGIHTSAARTPLHRPGVHVRPGRDAPLLPRDLSGLSWVVADAGTGEVLAAKDAHRQLPPASTLKALFAVTVLPRLPSWGRHTVTHAELEDIGSGSSRVGIVEGRSYRAADLWNGVFLSSGNDAVRALAAMNGGWRTSARQMEQRARQLGALDTQVVSPDGYDAPGQVSSAYDLAVFARAGLADPAFATYVRTVRARFPGGTDSRGRKGPSFEIQNTNRLLVGSSGVAPYPGLIGVKNGYTSRAGNTLISAARRKGRTLVVTVMNPQQGSVYEESRALLDWGFAASGRVTAVGSLKPSQPVKSHQAGGAPRQKPASPRHAAVAEEAESFWSVAGVYGLAVCLLAAAVVLGRRLP